MDVSPVKASQHPPAQRRRPGPPTQQEGSPTRSPGPRCQPRSPGNEILINGASSKAVPTDGQRWDRVQRGVAFDDFDMSQGRLQSWGLRYAHRGQEGKWNGTDAREPGAQTDETQDGPPPPNPAVLLAPGNWPGKPSPRLAGFGQ